MSFELANKKVVVVGLGLTGQSCVHFLLKQGATVIAIDTREQLQHDLTVEVRLGEYDQQLLLSAELILLSPGVDPADKAIQAAVEAGVELIGDVELFARFNTVPVIAITGSNGKSTVTTLVNEMLLAAGKKSMMGGNIGLPVLDLLGAELDYIVLELSSFQLETISSLNPLVATILNVTEDHIDRHKTLSNYHQAKQRVYIGARHIIVNRDDSLTYRQTEGAQNSFGLSASKQGFSWDDNAQVILCDGLEYLKQSECKLSGSHNMLNIQAAAACVKVIGIEDSYILSAAKQFTGLAHRFETISNLKNVRWINDSKATNVGATSAAILSFSMQKQGKLVLIAGGDGKGADFSPLTSLLNKYVDLLITFGKDGSKIAELVASPIEVANLKEAVVAADNFVESGDVVLLSPACASLDMFSNYQHRGECFIQAVRELAA